MIVRAPATSANLGPAFDAAAVALELWNELEVTDGEGVELVGEGEGELPTDETNLAVRAYALLADPAGKRFRFENRIPLERGLGSSAAAIALGLAAARPDGEPEELLAAGRELESHADNLAAALVGGVTPDLGRADRADRRDAAAHRRRARPARAHVDRGVARRRSRRPCRTSTPLRTPARAALLGGGGGGGRRGALRGGARRPAARAVPPVRGARRASATTCPKARAARRSPGSGPTVIVWADDAAACARELARAVSRARRPRAPGGPARRAVTVLVDCRPLAAYESGHVPGAVHLDPERDLSAPADDPAVGGRHPLPDPGTLAAAFGAAGIDGSTFVLAYDEGTGWAARCWWLLRHLGHDACGTFDLRAYVGAARPRDTRVRAAPATFVAARPRPTT